MLLRWTLTDVWSDEMVRRFGTALMRHVMMAEREGATFASVGDCSQFPRQSPAVLEDLNSFANLAIGRACRKVAIITGRPLTPRQLERADNAGLLQFFTGEAAALDWLGRAAIRKQA